MHTATGYTGDTVVWVSRISALVLASRPSCQELFPLARFVDRAIVAVMRQAVIG